MKKTKKSKNFKNQDVLGLLTVLVGKLTSFETKLDLVLSRINSQPAPKPVNISTPQKPLAPVMREEHRYCRPMYKAICADCRSLCQIPFKPVPGRPVYCQPCYRARKNASSVDRRPAEKPKEPVQVQAQLPPQPRISEPPKKVRKRPASKNKTKRK